MTKYEILQFDIEKHLQDGGEIDADLYRVQNDAKVFGKIDMCFYIKEYKVVSSQELHLSAEDGALDEIFKLGQAVFRDDRMFNLQGLLHSISVGDVIRNANTQESYIVMPDGFERLGISYEYHKQRKELHDQYCEELEQRFGKGAA